MQRQGRYTDESGRHTVAELRLADLLLAGVKVPVQTVAGTGSRGVYYYEATEWVAKQLGTELEEIPGGHTPYFDRPEDLAMAIRPFLRGVG